MASQLAASPGQQDLRKTDADSTSATRTARLMRAVFLVATCCWSLTMGTGCQPAQVGKIQVHPMWSSVDGMGNGARLAAGDLVREPSLAWKKDIRSSPSQYVATALADESMDILCLIIGVRQTPDQHLRREHILAIGLRLSDGKPLWRYEDADMLGYWMTPPLGYGCHPAALSKGRLYVASERGIMVIDVGTGQVVRVFTEDWAFKEGRDWTFTFNYPQSISLNEDGKHLILARGNGTVTCVSLADGQHVWERRVFDYQEVLDLQVSSKASTVVVTSYGTEGARIAALSSESGDLLWDKPYPRCTLFDEPVPYTSVVMDRLALAAFNEGSFLNDRCVGCVAAIDTLTGQACWKRKVDGVGILSVSADGERAWVVAGKRGVECVDLRHGTTEWYRPDPNAVRLARVGDVLLVLSTGHGDHGTITAVGDRGEKLWTKNVDDQWPSSELFGLGRHLVSVGKSSVHVYEATAAGQAPQNDQQRPKSTVSRP